MGCVFSNDGAEFDNLGPRFLVPIVVDQVTHNGAVDFGDSGGAITVSAGAHVLRSCYIRAPICDGR